MSLFKLVIVILVWCIRPKSILVEFSCVHGSCGFNLLKPNDIHICRTAALTSTRYILNIYSTNIHTEYFKHAA